MLQKLYKWDKGWWCGCIWIWANNNQVWSNIIAYYVTSTCLATTTIRVALPYQLCFVLTFVPLNEFMLVTLGTAGDWLYGLRCNIVLLTLLWKDLPASTSNKFVTAQRLRILHLLYSSEWREKKKQQGVWFNDPAPPSASLALKLWPDNWSNIPNFLSGCLSERAKAIFFQLYSCILP